MGSLAGHDHDSPCTVCKYVGKGKNHYGKTPADEALNQGVFGTKPAVTDTA